MLNCGNKFDDNITTDNFLSNKIVVNLDVFGSSMKYRVGSQGKGGEIVTPNERRIGQEKPQILEYHSNPKNLSSSGSKTSILHLNGGMRHHALLLRDLSNGC